MNKERFKTLVRDYYEKSGRHDLPWRKTRDPYRIMVSEVMLQQTQVSRVVKKYQEFIAAFPTVQSLAQSSTARLLKTWQGLGYNRRALSLRRAAEKIAKNYDGKFPKTKEELEELPGIGPSTSGGILAYAYGIPTVFLETNIRAVFIHHFFKNKESVHDKEILPLIESTLDRENPRDWYYALMDYGVHLKQSFPNPSRKSKHHATQSPFKGSNREIRSKILKYVLLGAKTEKEIVSHVGKTSHDVRKNIESLRKEGFIEKKSGRFRIKDRS